MLRNLGELVNKFRSQTIKDDSPVQHQQQVLFEPRDSGTESDVEESGDTKSLAVSQTSDYRTSQHSLFTGSSVAASDQESNSWDSFGCESGIQVNCGSISSLGAPHPTNFPSDFRGALVNEFVLVGAAVDDHSHRFPSSSAFKSVGTPAGLDGFRPTYLSSSSSGVVVGRDCGKRFVSAAMLPPGCQSLEDIECCSAQEEAQHRHDLLIPKSPADLEDRGAEIQRNFERLQAEMQDLVAKDPQSPCDVRFADESLDDDDISMLKSPERLVSPTFMSDQQQQQQKSTTTLVDSTKFSQLCDQLSVKRKRSQSQGRICGDSATIGQQLGLTKSQGGGPGGFNFLSRSSVKGAELNFASIESTAASQQGSNKFGSIDLQQSEVATNSSITKASLRSGGKLVVSGGIGFADLPASGGDDDLDGFKSGGLGASSPRAREDEEVQELMNTSGPSSRMVTTVEPRFFLRSSSCWKQTTGGSSINALNSTASVVKEESAAEAKVSSTPGGASKDGCPYLFRFRPKRAPIKLLVPPKSPVYKNSFPTSGREDPLVPPQFEGDKLSPRKRTRGEMAMAATIEQISSIHSSSRDSSTSQGARLSASMSDSSICPQHAGPAEQRPTLNFDKMREKMNKANTKKHCTIANAKSKFRNFASGRAARHNACGAEPVGCSFRPVVSSNNSLPP